MEFTVKFTTENRVPGKAIYIREEENYGSDYLDFVRSSLMLPDLDMKVLDDNVGGLSIDPVINLEESTVREINNITKQHAGEGLFWKTSVVVVTVSKVGSLNRFCWIDFERTGTERVRGYNRLSEPQLLKAWMEADCPLYWDPTPTE